MGAPDQQALLNVQRRQIKDSKMKALAKFDAEFSKPMADKNPKILDALYFRGGA